MSARGLGGARRGVGPEAEPDGAEETRRRVVIVLLLLVVSVPDPRVRRRLHGDEAAEPARSGPALQPPPAGSSAAAMTAEPSAFGGKGRGNREEQRLLRVRSRSRRWGAFPAFFS